MASLQLGKLCLDDADSLFKCFKLSSAGKCILLISHSPVSATKLENIRFDASFLKVPLISCSNFVSCLPGLRYIKDSFPPASPVEYSNLLKVFLRLVLFR